MSDPLNHLSFQQNSQLSPGVHSQQANIQQYKEALQHMKLEYQHVQQKLLQKEEHIENLLSMLAGENGGKDTQNFELINQTFQLKSEINKLKYLNLEEKNAHEKSVQEYEGRIEELENQLGERLKELNQLVDDMTSQKKRDLVSELEKKAQEFVNIIEDLEGNNVRLEGENRGMRERIAEMELGWVRGEKGNEKSRVSERSQEEVTELQRSIRELRVQVHESEQNLSSSKDEASKYKDLLTVSQASITKLSARIKQLEQGNQNVQLILSDKVKHSQEEIERMKKMNERYKSVIGEKDAELLRLNDLVLNMELEKTSIGKTDSDSVSQYMGKIKELSEENRLLVAQVKKIEAAKEEQVGEIQLEFKKLHQEFKDKKVEFEKLRAAGEVKESEYKDHIQRLTGSNTNLEQEIKRKSTNTQQLQTQLSRSQKQHIIKLQQLQSTNKTLQQQLQQRQIQIRQLTEPGKKPFEINRKQPKQEQNLKVQLTNMKEEIREKQLLELELKEEIETLKEQVMKSETEIRVEKDQRKKSLADITQLNRTVKELTHELSTAQQMSDRNNSQIKQKSQQLKDVITQLRHDLTNEREKMKTKEHEILTTKGQVNRVSGEKELLGLKLEEAEIYYKSLETKSEGERDMHKKNVERLNAQVDTLRKEIIELKKGDTKLREDIFSETLKVNQLESKLEGEKHKVQELEISRKKFQQTEESTKKRLEEALLSLSSLGIELEDKTSLIRELEMKFGQEKERFTTRTKKLQDEVGRLKVMEAELEELRIRIGENERVGEEKVRNKEIKRSSSERQRENEKERNNVSSFQMNKLRRSLQSHIKESHQLRQELQSLQSQHQNLKKQHILTKKQLAISKKSLTSSTDKLEQLDQINKQLQGNYDTLLKEKMKLNQEKNKEIRRLQSELEEMNGSQASKIERLELKSTPEEIVELKSKNKSLEGKVFEITKEKIELQQKLKQVDDEKSLLENKIEILKMQGGEKKKGNTQEGQDKRGSEGMEELRRREEQYNTLLDQHHQLKEKNTTQIEELQTKIREMNQTLVAEKKEYQIKNALKFQEETSAYNQLNRVNKEREDESAAFAEERKRLRQEIDDLEAQVRNYEGRIAELKFQNQQLIESKSDGADNKELHLRLKILNEQMEELRNTQKIRTPHPETQVQRQLEYIADLERKCRQIQQANSRMIDYNTVKTQSMVVGGDYQIRENYAQLLEDYSTLSKINKQLESQRSRSQVNQVYRPHTQHGFTILPNNDQELRNVYKQVEVLNNIIMDKDLQIQGLKKVSHPRLVPTPDLPPRMKTTHNNMGTYRLAEPSLTASGSFKRLRPASLHGSNLG